MDFVNGLISANSVWRRIEVKVTSVNLLCRSHKMLHGFLKMYLTKEIGDFEHSIDYRCLFDIHLQNRVGIDGGSFSQIRNT